MIKKILAIGGTGLLGFPVAKQLKNDGYDVDILGLARTTLDDWLGQKNVL